MKKLIFATVILLAMAAINSCKKNDSPTFLKENCRVLATIAPKAGPYPSYTITYTYDAKGYINSEFTKIGEDNIEFRYYRNNNGQIESTELFVNGESVFLSKYSYPNGRDVHIDEFNPDGSPAGIVREIKYNNKGLIIEISSDYADDPDFNEKKLYKYNDVGQIIKITREYKKGGIYSYDVITQKGIPSPASEIYLTEHGLPYQNLFLTAYGYSDPGIGSTIESFEADGNGMKLIYTLTVKSKTLNARGYTESIEYQDGQGQSTFSSYQFDCAK